MPRETNAPLREEVSCDAVRADLIDAMQPTASLWLREQSP